MEERRFYVYGWFYLETSKIFHIGKGTGERYKNTTTHRNQFFKNIIAKYKNKVSVKKLKEDLTEQEAWDLEIKLIAEYQAKGECETNFHKGGCGGHTGNYKSKERSEKLSKAASKRTGSKNSMYGKHHSEKLKRS